MKCIYIPERGMRSDSRSFEGGDRPQRGKSRRSDEEMETFRIEVGRAHQVQPGNIVGAIANEIGIDSSYIGRIEILEDFSTVDLPLGMPPELFQVLKKVWVAGRPLNITRLGEPRPEPSEKLNHKPTKKPKTMVMVKKPKRKKEAAVV